MARPIGLGSIDDDRYDRSRKIAWMDLERVSKARVLVVGAGALGNEVSKDLALSGFRNITIVDMDHVVGSNLNRCLFFRRADADNHRPKAEVVALGIKSLSEDSAPEPFIGRIQDFPAHRFKSFEVVLGCLDNIEARIHVNSHSYAARKIYIDGGMNGMIGRVVISKPPHGACLQCGMNRSHGKIANLRFSCTGKDVVFHEPRLGAEITTTSFISAVMVREALKVVSKRHEMLLNNALYYDGQRNVSEEMEIARDPECSVHGAQIRGYR